MSEEPIPMQRCPADFERGPPDAARRSRERAGMSKSLMSDASVLARRNLEHIRQVPEKLTNVTVQPLMFVLLFAYVFGGAIVGEGRRATRST